MTNPKPNIIISIPLVWSYRNFIINGICKQLQDKFTVFYAIPKVAEATFLENGILQEHLIIHEVSVQSKLQIYFFRILKSAFLIKNPVNTENIFKNLKPKSNKFSTLKEIFLYKIPSLLFTSNISFRFLEKIENKLYLKKYNHLIDKIKNINPSFYLSTTNVVDTEWPFFRVCQNLNIKTITHILSFDNLTSRGYLPISHFDKYLVWNDNMKQELIKYYSIASNKIIVTGTPQFDYHLDNKFLMSKTQTYTTLGLQEIDNYILYCANHVNISPNEPALLESILNEFLQDSKLSSYKIVLRLHPMDDYDRWNILVQKFPNITLSLPWAHDDKNAIFWGNPNIDDLKLFSNTLRYASIMLNIASTVSIDAAICNTPIVCLGFHPNNQKESIFYNEVHFSEHYLPIMNTNAVPLATSIENLLVLTKENIIYPEKLNEERLLLKKYFVPENLKSSAETIIEILNNV